MALERQVENSVEERVARADEGRERLALRRNQFLLEGDTLVARHHRISHTNLAVAVPDRRRHVGDLVAAWLTLAGSPPQTLEGFKKERLDVVRLEAPRFAALHLFTDARHSARIHGIMGERAIFDQAL